MARRSVRKEMTPAQERAWRAIRAFNRIKPQLMRYARALTGNPKLGLEATAEGTFTDGKTIFVRPPARLGDNTPHDKVRCNKRNVKTKRQMCAACDTHEMVIAALLHEIAHITFGTLEEPTPAGVRPILDLIDEWHPTDACDHAEKIRKNMASEIEKHGDSYMLRCNMFDQVLGLLLNAFEDSRVNAGMFAARPGSRVMFDLHLQEIFDEGIDDFGEEEDPDASPAKWQDRSRDEQVLIGMFLASSEHFDHIDMLSESAKQIIWSDRIDLLLTEVSRASSAHEVTNVTVDVFRALQELDVMVIPKCVKVEEEDASDDADGDGSLGTEDSESSGADSDGSGSSESGDPGTQAAPSSGTSTGDLRSESAGGSGSPGHEKPLESEAGGDREDPREDEDDSGPNSDASDVDSDEGADSGSPDTDGRADAGTDNNGDGVHQDMDVNNSSGHDDGEGESSGDDTGDDSNDDAEEPASEGQDEDGVSTDPTSVDRDALTKLAQRMTMHALIHEEVGDADVTDFATGASVLSGVGGEEDDDGGGPKVIVPVASGGLSHEEIEEFLKILGTALEQALHFDAPSVEVQGVDVITYPNPDVPWRGNPGPENFMPGEDILGKVTNEARLTFEENKRSRYDRGRKTGRVNARSLARRAPFDDPRMFKKKVIPGKRDYFVLIGFDVSGSTARWVGDRRNRYNYAVPNTLNTRIKRAVFAQAEMCHRLGIPFEIWAHTSGFPLDKIREPGFEFEGSSVWAYQVKLDSDQWNEDTKIRLAAAMDNGGNLDGHTLEFYRKRVERRTETDRFLCYYTDGAMPMENYAEEKVILEREVEHCRKSGIHLLAVGIMTDSPRKYGFDTVEVSDDVDLVRVPRQLARALTRQ